MDTVAQKLKTLDLETLLDILKLHNDRGYIEEEVSTPSGIRGPNDEFEIAVCGYRPCGDGKYLKSVWHTIKVQDPDPERPSSSGNVTIKKKLLYPLVRMMYKTKQHVALGFHLYSLGGLYPVGSEGDSDSDGDIAHPFESKRYRRVWRLDVNRPSAGWKAVPPMTFPNRYDPPSVALQGKLYVLGGFFKSQFPEEAAVKELGWMEAYDPISNTWEPLPNPPSGFFLDADPLIFAALESKNQILVARYNHDDRKLICDSATFCIYDVITRTWTKLEPDPRMLFARYPDRTERRSIAVGNTLYWGLLEDEDIIVQAYELDKDIWIHGRFNIRPFVAKDEFLADNIFPASPPLLHLNNQRFCLFFLTSCYDRSTCQVRNLYLNCLIIDISPINDKDKPHKQHDYYDHACYRVIDEKDNDNINYHVHEHDHFWRLNISIVSIQKYPLVNPIQLWDAVLLKQTWFLETGFSKRKDHKKCLEIRSTEMKKRCLIPKFEFSLPHEISFSKCLTQCQTSAVDDLQLNRDGVRFFPESPPSIKPSDHQLSLADLDTIKVIGKGYGGIVHLVQHKWTGKFFALKVVQMYIEEPYRKSIDQEMRINETVECPYVVPCYQSFYVNGVISLLLEYMDGGSLLDFLKRVKTIPEPYLAAICKQVLKGLLYLHDEKLIIHRDLKPSNLLINHRGEVKITDFGVSRIVESPTGTANTFVGTFNYMSPERIVGGKYNFKSDIWSLGILLLECATGQFPYSPSEHGEGWANFYELMEAIVEKPLPSVPADHFSQEFSSFISACVQKEPKDRQSARELMTHPFIAMYEDLDIDLSSYFTNAGSPLATL